MPRLEINLKKIRHNTRELVKRLGSYGISVSGVTKAVLGMPEIANTLLASGVIELADSRIENIQRMKLASVKSNMSLIRSPMKSQAAMIVEYVDTSLNTELDVISELSKAAGAIGRKHSVILMVELGDLREGIMPEDLENVVRSTLKFPNIILKGIGANLACRCGIEPDKQNMGQLSAIADSIDNTFGIILSVVSGGNSSNLNWVFEGEGTGRINNLRLGESILLGREPLHRQKISGLHTDAVLLVAEVIESKRKPSLPWGKIAETAFGFAPVPLNRNKNVPQAIIALGQMDTDPEGLTPPIGINIIGSSSDHLVVASDQEWLPVGREVTFQVNYSALIRAMISPFVTKDVKDE